MAVAQVSGVSQNGIEELKRPSKERVELDRDDFMKLFVTQLQYQDPMNPMESAEMATQVAQFNMVDLLYKNNNSMEKLVDATRARGLADAVAFMGREVTYKGHKVELSTGGSQAIEVEPSGPTVSTVLTISDENGKVVRTQELGAIDGTKVFVWDGTTDSGEEASPGTYTVRVNALDDSGNEVEVSTWTTGKVVGIKAGKDGEILLSLDTGETTRLSDIEKVGR